MTLWNTTPQPTQAKAFLGNSSVSAIFSFNPDEVKWSYKNNTVTRDTIGGRVVQILSSSVEAMTVTGRTGSRERLQKFAGDLKKVMQYQIKTGDPVNFKVPSRNWHFLVYVQNVSNLGWDVSATSYPYQIVLMIKDDLTGIVGKEFTEDAFSHLIKNIGYNGKFHGGDVDSALKYSEAIVNAVNAIDYSQESPSTVTPLSGAVGKYKSRVTGDGGNQTLANALLAKVDTNNIPVVSNKRYLTISEIYRLSYWALSEWGSLTGDKLKQTAIMATAISCCESGSHDTEAINRNATNGTAYGLWQMNEGLGTSLYDPVIAALQMAQSYYKTQWLYWGCGPDHGGGYKNHLDEVRKTVG